MRRAYSRRIVMWRVVPCGSAKSLRTESWKDIEEILQSKLATINEEPENLEESDHHHNSSSPSTRLKRFIADKAKKKRSSSNKEKNSNNKVMPRFSIKDSYALFMTRFATKGSFAGLLQY